MPTPELHLSLSMTDNAGSPLYTGHKAREKMGTVDSRMEQHRIIVTISNQQVGEVNVDIANEKWLSKETISLPTYKMKLTDTKTEEESIYEVVRDKLLINKISQEKTGGVSFFGKKLFAKDSSVMPSISLEPTHDRIQTFKATRKKVLTQNSIYYNLLGGAEKAYLIAGIDFNQLLANTEIDHLFYIIDNNEGKQFIGDILYRERFLKLTPQVEVQVIKRDTSIKKVIGRSNKIVYI